MFLKFRSLIMKADETGRKKSKRFCCEPLIHFFILGVAVFGLHTLLDRKPEANLNDPYLVEVSSADIEWMQTLFKKKMGREPTVRDLTAQVHQLIREQILSREAVAMGLDEGDRVVRRRLAQKMEFLFKDLSDLSEPTKDELRNYYTENRPKYEIPPQVTFSQAYFSIDRRGIDGAKKAAIALIEENTDPNKVATFGDTSLLPPGCNTCSKREIRDRFGNEFAETIVNLEPGKWHGPVKSAYGLHAVYIHDRRNANFPELHAIIDQVKNDWLLVKQEKNTRKIYGEIRSRYKVLVEGLPYGFDKQG